MSALTRTAPVSVTEVNKTTFGWDDTAIQFQGLCVATALYIQQMELLASLTGQSINNNLSIKVYLVLTGLATLAEAHARSALVATCKLVDFITKANGWSTPSQVMTRDRAFALSQDFFAALSCPTALCDKLLKYEGPMSRDIREKRIRGDLSDADILRKVAKEKKEAQTQMQKQLNGTFKYQEATLDFVKNEPEKRVGPFRTALSSFQNPTWRATMEDEHLATSFSLPINGKEYPLQLFGVFDGHGGISCAAFVKEHLQEVLTKNLQLFNPKELTDRGIWNALKITFVELNTLFRKAHPVTEKAGTTACVVMALDDKLWTANAGDTRALLVDKKGCIQLSDDAKPSNSRFKRGVARRGADVLWNDVWRVDGILATARAIGDRHVTGVTARPKITCQPLSEVADESLLVIACDGVFDVASTKQIAKACCDHKEETADRIARNITYSAAQSGSKDNISTLVVKLPCRL